MKFNPKLKQDIAKFFTYVIVVEGKKDLNAMHSLGFERVYEIHQTGVPIRERVLKISEDIDRKNDKLCILTDFDKKGKMLYFLLKNLFQEQGIKLDSKLRGLLLVSGISHIEGLPTFFSQVENI